MPVTGFYMAHRIHRSAIPYVKAYGQNVLENVVPAFQNLSEKADAIVNAEFKRLGEQPAGEDCDGDMSVAAEAAQDQGQVFYNTMLYIRQTSLNLFAAGLFHLIEQELAALCRDGAFNTLPPKGTKIEEVASWFNINFCLNLRQLSSWPKIDQLRLLANSVKHGEGKSAQKLREIRPDIFQNPTLRELLPDFPQIYSAQAVHRPMAGEDIFVTTQMFIEFSQAANSFLAEIADYFAEHQRELFS